MYNTELTKNWLLGSGIQNNDGSINSWYDLEKNIYPYIYPETTGYAITSFLFINRQKPERLLVERAKMAADWLIKRNATHENSNNEKPEPRFIYAFDNGMILTGLMNIYEETKEKKYLEGAKKIADELLKMQKENGEFYAFYNKNTKELIDSDEKWSTQSGSYHAKLAIGLLKAYEATKNDAYKEATEKICKAALKMQQQDGRFISCRKRGFTHIHPHLYSAEGFLYAGKELNNKEHIKVARKAAEWVLDNVRDDGGINCIYEGKWFKGEERSDTLAQTIRLAKLLGIKHQKEEKLKQRLLSFINAERKQKGGFFYCIRNRKMVKHLNSWCSMFALQALMINEGNKEEGLKLLI